MSGLTYSNYDGFGQLLSDTTHYSQAVRIPATSIIIKISGQGPWNAQADDGAIKAPSSPKELCQQVDKAFSNVELALKHAGSRGWEDVYLVRIYYVVQEEGAEWKEGLERMLAFFGDALRVWSPSHRPLLTVVEVKALAAEGMVIEVEVEATVNA